LKRELSKDAFSRKGDVLSRSNAFSEAARTGQRQTLLDWKQTEGDGLDDGAAESVRLLGFG